MDDEGYPETTERGKAPADFFHEGGAFREAGAPGRLRGTATGTA